MRAVLYIRVSTDEQAESGYSIPEQRRELSEHARCEGWQVVDEAVDDGFSGAVLSRPGLDRVRELAEAGDIDVVLAKKRNRFFRDRFLRMGFERQLAEYNVTLMALDDAGHRFADAVMDEFSDWFKEEVRQNTIAGRLQKAREGKLIACHTPIYGFEYTEDHNAFTPVAEHMAVVERIIRSIASGKTLHSAKRELEAENIPTPSGGSIWGAKTIREIVKEDAYRPYTYSELAPLLEEAGATPEISEDLEYGIVWYPRRKVTTLEPDPRRGYKRPQQTAYYEQSEQVPIPVVASGIPQETVDRARQMIKDNRPSRSLHHREYELSGIIRCSECGCVMATNRKVANGREYFYYRCANYQRNGLQACEMNAGFPAEVTEHKVLSAVLDAVKDKDELIRKANEDFEAKKARLMRAGGTDARGWLTRLSQIENQRANYQRAFGEGVLSLDDLKARTSELDNERERIETVLEEYESREERLQGLESTRDRTVELIERGAWAELGITSAEARRERYRRIGLSAQAWIDGRDKFIRLEWQFGERESMGTVNLSSLPGTGTMA